MAEPGALAVPFVLGRDFNVAEIQVLLRQALTRALRAYPLFLALLDAEKNRQDYLAPTREFNPQDQVLDIRTRSRRTHSPIGFVRCDRAACRTSVLMWSCVLIPTRWPVLLPASAASRL